MKKTLLLFALILLICGYNYGATTLISPTGEGGFEAGATFPLNNWTVVNGTYNVWTVGSLPVVYAGTNCAFGWNGTTWTGTANAAVNHFYRDITFPAGESAITLKFYYKLSTTDPTYDYLKVFLVPTSTVPVAGTALTTGQVGLTAGYDAATTWTLVTITLPPAAAGTTQRLVFSWRQDGVSPFAVPAVDNIELTSMTPVTPDSPPISFTAAPITQTSMTIGWTDNSTNEVGFRVYRSTDNVNFVKIGSDVVSTSVVTTGNLYSQAQTGLIPGTTYYYKITAYTDLETLPLTGNAPTLSPGTITSTGTGGLWNATSTWSTGIVPTATDNVTIADGATVTINVTTATCWNLTVGQGASGILNYLAGTASTLTVNGGVTVSANASFNAGTGALTTHALYIGGNTNAGSGGFGSLTNNGVFDMYTTAGVVVTFFGIPDAVISGSGTTLDFYRVVLNKGAVTATTTVTPPVLDLQSAFTIQGLNALGFLYTHTAGVLKISGTFTQSNITFGATGYTIPALGGFWLNNPNYTVSGQNGSPSNAGLLRVTAGTYNIGTSAGNSLTSSANSIYIIEGGAINVAGRFYLSSAGVYYNQSAGTLTVQTVGNTSTTQAGFYISSSAGNTWVMSGGKIVIQFANTGTTPYNDYYNFAPNRFFTGGDVQFGNALSGSALTYRMYGYMPNVVIDGTYAHTVKDYYSASGGGLYNVILGNLTLNTGTTYNTNGNYAVVQGSTITNNGAIVGTLSTDQIYFVGLGPQTYSGTGTFGTNAAPYAGVGVGIANPSGVTLSAPIITTRVNLYTGQFINSNQISLGAGGSASVFIQRGGSAPSPAGSFDVAPTFNLGTGTYTVTYYSAGAVVNTGLEIPSSRTVTNLSVNSAPGVNLLGGDITVGTAAAGVLTLTLGVLNTGGSTITLPYTGTSISAGSATSYVDGKLVRSFPASRTASGTYTAATFYPIGNGATYMPLYVDPTTNAGGSVTISGQAFLTNDGTMGTGVNTLSAHRWQALVTAGAANLTGNYLQIGDAGIVTGNQILQAQGNTGAYAYNAISSGSAFATGTPPTLTTTGSQIPAAGYYGYLAYGNLTSCDSPVTQPSALVVTYKTATGFNGSFTPAGAPVPSNYLVVRYPGGSAVTAPVNYTAYTVGAALGLGTVRSISNATSWSETGLTAGTTYDYYFYSYNNSGCYGPVYNLISPYTASVTTCTPAIGVPGTPTATLVNVTSFQANWTASSTAGVTYILDVATNSTFTSFVPGYQLLNVGSVLTYPVTGLAVATPYYVRVRANSGGTCYSDYTATLAVTTSCYPVTSIPWSENFDAMPAVGNNIIPSCWLATSTSGTPWYSGNAASITYNDPCSAPNYVYVYYTPYSGVTKYLFTPGITLTAGASYDLTFKWVGDGYSGWTGDVLVNSAQNETGASLLGTSFVVAATTTTATCTPVTYTYVPGSTGTYYFMIRVTSTVSPYYLGFDDFSLGLTPLPVVTTTLATSITGSSAISGGNVVSGGGVSARGVCYGMAAAPTIAGTHTTDGAGLGTFISTLTPLSASSLYYYRAYATNANGTAYGDEHSFTTLNVFAPTVTMDGVSAITNITATAAGTVVTDGGSPPILENGFVYSLNPLPLVGGVGVTKVSVALPGVGIYSAPLTSLVPGSRYYINAYAINVVGTSYGTETSFVTNNVPTVTTTLATSINATSAMSGGQVSIDGGQPVTARGVCYGTTAGPGLSGTFTTDGTGVGVFTSTLSPLTANTLYYYRAYATNIYGTSFGTEYSFTTPCDPSSLPFAESFDGTTFAPACWTNLKTAGTGTPGTWIRATTGVYPTCSNHSGAGMAEYNSYGYGAGTIGILATLPVTIPNDQYKVDFWMFRDSGYPADADLINVYYNTAPNTSGATLLGTVNRYYLSAPAVTTTNLWYEYAYNVPAGISGVGYIVFEGVSAYGNNMYIDDVSLVSTAIGNLNGYITDCSTGDPVIGVTVSVGALSDVTDPFGYYEIAGVPVGTQTVTASLTGYSNTTGTAVITPGGTTSKDLCMNIVLDPPVGLSATVQNQYDVHVSWSPPGTIATPDQWIHWDNGTNAWGIGYGATTPCDIDAVIRYTTTDLIPYSGMYLKKIRFYAAAAATTWKLEVWQGTNPPNYSTPIYTQTVTVTASAWNEYTLTTPILINTTQELWFGYNVVTTAGYPAGADAGPAVAGEKNWIYDGGWYEMVVSGLDMNWNVQGWVSSSALGPVLMPLQSTSALLPAGEEPSFTQIAAPQKVKPLGIHAMHMQSGVSTESLDAVNYAPLAPAWTVLGYNVYRDDIKINPATVTDLFYNDLSLAPATYAYKVTAVYAQGESSAVGPINVTIYSCGIPVNLPPVSVTSTNATFNWTPAGGTASTNWIVEYGYAGFVHGAGTTVPVSGSPTLTVTTLSPGVSYDVYVRTDCGSDLSPWSNVETFTTTFVCPAGSVAETEACGGDANGGCNMTVPAWEPLVCGETACGTAYCNGTNRDTDWYTFTLTEPSVVTWGGTAEFGFLIGLIDGRSGCPVSGFMTSNVGTAGQYKTVSATLGVGTYYAFFAPSSFTTVITCGTSDKYWSKLTCSTACVAPVDLGVTDLTTTSAKLIWSSSSASKNVEWGPGVFSHGSGANLVPGVTDNFLTIPVSSASTYTFFVQGDCGGGDLTSWSGPYTFNTPCDVTALPACEAFTVAATIPTCWSQNYTGTVTSNRFAVTTSNLAGGTTPYEITCTYQSAVGTANMFSPGYDVTGLASVHLAFRQMYNDYTSGADVSIMVQSSPDGMIWTPVWTHAGGVGASIAAELWEMDVPVTGNSVYFAWTVDGNLYDINYWYIDDICVTPNVPPTKTLTVKAFLQALTNSGTGLMNEAQGDAGSEFGAGIADHVTVELHDAVSPFDISATYPAFTDLELSTSGVLNITTIPSAEAGDYYIVIKHRNSIETWSMNPVSLAGAGPVIYDFSAAASQAFGNNQVLVGTVYAIYGGDINQDGIVDGADMSAVFNTSQPPALTGYNPEDINGDGIVDGADMSVIFNNSQPPAVQVQKP